MKKALLILIFSTLALAFAACGDNIVPAASGDDDACFDPNCPDVDPPDAGMPSADPDGGACVGVDCPADGGSGGSDAGSGSDGGSGSDAGTCGTCPEGTTCVDGACVCDGQDSGGSCQTGETLLCHVPPGNPAGAHAICVGDAAVDAHLRHGDTTGACP